MFSTLNLNAVLDEHEIFEDLSKIDDDSQAVTSRPQQIIHIRDGNLFVWDDQQSCLRTTNLRSVINDKDKAENIQSLLCQNPPLFQVRSVKFNESCSHVALIGSRGATVMVLPHRWGKDAEYEGGKSSITCRTFAIAERFLISNISIQLIQASWYPGATFLHLCLLTSDNILRIYNVQSDSQMPIQTHRFNQLIENNLSMTSSRASLLSMYSVTSSLGETVVAFDFAAPIDYIEKRKMLTVKQPEPITLQPIYLLQGNGDILLLLISLTNNKYSKGILHGPLIMLPAAEDNYGTESCSIHVVKTSPSIIVIATATGKLYHCIALWSNDSIADLDSSDVDQQSIVSKGSQSRLEMSTAGEILPPTIYVYETVELELDLTVPDDGPESRQITLHGDPVLGCRYHCCTSVGIHSIALPWLSRMDKFVNSDDEDKDLLTDFGYDDPCTVEHVLCTKPTLLSHCSIIGLTIASDPMFGPSIICLTDDNHCTAVPLLSTFRSASPPLMSFIDDDTVITSPLKKISEVNFEDHVKSLLKRDASQPIIKTGDWDGEPNDRESLRLVTRATQVLRDEYILKQKLAKDAICKRVQLLKEQKEHQLEDLKELNKMKDELSDNAEKIASEYEDCKERQQNLLERLEAVVKRVTANDPHLSKAEINMGKELKALSSKLRLVDSNIQQLKIKQVYQEKKQEKQEGFLKHRFDQQTTSQSVQIEKFKQIILEEGETISDLIKKLNNMNVQVGL